MKESIISLYQAKPDSYTEAEQNLYQDFLQALDEGRIRACEPNGSSWICLLYTSPSPRDRTRSRMPSSACKKKSFNIRLIFPPTLALRPINPAHDCTLRINTAPGT